MTIATRYDLAMTQKRQSLQGSRADAPSPEPTMSDALIAHFRALCKEAREHYRSLAERDLAYGENVQADAAQTPHQRLS